MQNSFDPASATPRLRLAGTLALCFVLTGSVLAADDDPSNCEDGSAVVAAVPLDSPLPALEEASEGCPGFETPRAKFQVGDDGQTNYIGLDRSTGCLDADAELRRWIACWTYQPARCGAEAVTEVIEIELSLPASPEWGLEPPCDRQADPE